MNLSTDAFIQIEYTAHPGDDSTVSKTLLGTNVNLAAAMVLVFESHPDFFEAVDVAVHVYKTRLLKP